jgi:hypothetical protein
MNNQRLIPCSAIRCGFSGRRCVKVPLADGLETSCSPGGRRYPRQYTTSLVGVRAYALEDRPEESV